MLNIYWKHGEYCQRWNSYNNQQCIWWVYAATITIEYHLIYFHFQPYFIPHTIGTGLLCDYLTIYVHYSIVSICLFNFNVICCMNFPIRCHIIHSFIVPFKWWEVDSKNTSHWCALSMPDFFSVNGTFGKKTHIVKWNVMSLEKNVRFILNQNFWFWLSFYRTKIILYLALSEVSSVYMCFSSKLGRGGTKMYAIREGKERKNHRVTNKLNCSSLSLRGLHAFSFPLVLDWTKSTYICILLSFHFFWFVSSNKTCYNCFMFSLWIYLLIKKLRVNCINSRFD